MNAQIVELTTYHHDIHAPLLEAVGFANPLEWRAFGILNTGYTYKGVKANPALVAHHRLHRLLVVAHIAPAGSVPRPTPDEARLLRLSACVVMATMRKNPEYPIERVEAWYTREWYQKAVIEIGPHDWRDYLHRVRWMRRRMPDKALIHVKDIVAATTKPNLHLAQL